MKNAKNFEENLQKFVRARQALPAVDRDRLVAAVNYHNLAMTSPTDEARLVNLWIALECIATDGGPGIIEAVVAAVAPTLALRNVEKLTTGLASYVVAALKSSGVKDAPEYRVAFPTSRPEFIEKVELLDVLRDEQNGARIEALYSLVKHNPLLCLRVHHFRKNILGSPEKVADNLQFHQRNVDWQLRRIYRARNLVAHRARAPTGLRHLLQHLQTYFLSVVEHVVNDVAAHPEWGIRTALEHRALLLEHLLRELRTENRSKLTIGSLLNPDLLLGRADSGPVVWSANRASQAAPSGGPGGAGATSN